MMNALSFSFLAASCAALSNLFFRRNGGNPSSTYSQESAFLCVLYLFSLILSLVCSPQIWVTPINFVLLGMGMCVGVLNAWLMNLTAKALQEGPAGLTFAFQNASAIFPGILLFMLLGTPFGFSISYLQLLGMGLVLMGLFVGAKPSKDVASTRSLKWLKYALACFAIQVLALTLIQARCVFFDCERLARLSFLFDIKASQDVWFLPGQFGAALGVQTLMFFKQKHTFSFRALKYGVLSGLANFGSSKFLLLATKFALPFERNILFPLFAVSTIALCNTWANRLYQEKFNILANILCAVGIFLGCLAAD